MQAGVALAAIRANVYLNAILTRDYLLDSDSSHAQQYIDQFDRIQANTEKSFRTLEALGLDDEQKVALNQLRKELTAYWDPTEVVLDWSPEEKRAQRAEMLRQRVRRRQEIFALAEQVERLVTANFTRERQRITTADREFRVFARLDHRDRAAVRIRHRRRNSRAHAGTRAPVADGRIGTPASCRGRSARRRNKNGSTLSRELHDQVGQMLTGLRMELASIARIHGESESEISSRIARAKGTVEQTLRIVRNIAMLLRPSMLDDLGLTPALAWLLKEVSQIKRLRNSFRYRPGGGHSCPMPTGLVYIESFRRR